MLTAFEADITNARKDMTARAKTPLLCLCRPCSLQDPSCNCPSGGIFVEVG